MKKTLIAIIAVMLIIAMSLTLFACNKDNGGNNNKGNEGDGGNTTPITPPSTTGKELTEAELGDYEALTRQMVIYADQYLTNNATDTLDVSAALKKAIEKQVEDIDGEPIKDVVVKLESDGCYSIKFVYSNNNYYTYREEGKLQARTAEKGYYAGYTPAAGATKVDYDTSLANVYNAFVHTLRNGINDATEFGEYYQAVASGESLNTPITFGGSVEGAFMLNYGVGEGQIGPMSYGLKVYGTLGYTAAETEVAIEAIDELAGEVLVGLYYKNTTLYLGINVNGYEQKVYLDNADINQIVGSFFGFEDEQVVCYDIVTYESYEDHNFVDGYCTQCGAIEPEEVVETEPFFEKKDKNGNYVEYESIKKAIGDMVDNQIVGTVVGIVGGLLNCTSANVNGVTRYQYSLDIGALLDKLLSNSVLGPAIAEAVNPIVGSIEFLSALKLDSFKGIGGVLTLTFDVAGLDSNKLTKGGGTASTLAGVQIAYNAAQQDFRWNADDDVAKVYGPINGAITIKDFAIGEQEVDIDADEYDYFSPLNAEFTAEITLTGYSDDTLNGDYVLTARSEFNPFVLEEGAAEIILDKVGEQDNVTFLHIYISNVADFDCDVIVAYDGDLDGTPEYFQTKASESDFFQKLGEEFFGPMGAKEDNDSVIAPIVSYIWELVDQFSKPYTYADLTKLKDNAVAEIEALAVTEKDADGNVLPSSEWLDAIKTNAISQINTIYGWYDEESEEEELKAAKSNIEFYLDIAKSDYQEQLEKEGKVDSFLEGLNVIALVQNVSKLKDLFVGDEGAANPAVFDYKLDFNDLQLHADLNYEVYNSVIDILKVAIPKLTNFDSTAATVKVDMNYDGATDNKGKLKVNVTYGDYVVDGVISIKDCFVDGKLASTCNMTFDLLVKIPNDEGTVISYVYAGKIAFNNWDKNNGTITITFDESDGARVTSASDRFVSLVITQKWSGEEYQGFSAVLTLNSRKADGSGMNEAHVYNVIGGKDENGLYYVTLDLGDEDVITLGIGNWSVKQSRNTLSFGIPSALCGVTLRVASGSEDVTISIANAGITKWGTDDVEIEGIEVEGDSIINTEEDKAADDALYQILVDKIYGFFYAEQ